VTANLASIQKSAPPLFLSSKPTAKSPAVRKINPAAVTYIGTWGPQLRSMLPNIDALVAIYPRDAAAFRAMVPALTIQTDPADQGVQSLNPAAVAFAVSSKIPFANLYPVAPPLVRWAHSGGHGWQEINPAAISYVQQARVAFSKAYPYAPPWSSDIDGSKDTAIQYSQLVDRPFDGPGGVYTNIIHESGFDVGDFTRDAVNTCGAAVGSGINAIDQATGAIGKIPIIGSFLNAELNWTFTVLVPLNEAEEIAKGESLDHVLLQSFNDAMRDIHTMAPYIETVIATVPGIGPVASGAIAAGLALASGEPIDQALVDAAAASIPGGAIVKAVYHAGVTILSGHGDATTLTLDALDQAANALGVPVPPEASQVIAAGVSVTVDIANGKKPQDALLNAAIAALPTAAMRSEATAARNAVDAVAKGKNVADVLLQYGPTMLKGFPADQVTQLTNGLMTGMSMGVGQSLQAIQQSGLAHSIGQLADAGKAFVDGDPVLATARALNSEAAQYGYDVGAELTRRVVTRFQIEATRALLNAEQQVGYDMALALHIARVTQKSPPTSKAPVLQSVAGYYVGHGVRNMPAPQKKVVLNVVAAQPAAAVGTQLAATQIQAAKAAWWKRYTGTGAGLVVGGLLSIPLAMLTLPALAIGGAVGGGVDLVRSRRKPSVSHGEAAK
jgi:hypothetical protein